MANHYKKRLKLSVKTNQLKKEIHELSSKKINALNKLHQGSKVLSSIFDGINNFLGVISAIAKANKDIPLVGVLLQLISMIPKSIAIITAPNKTVSERIFAATFLATIASLLIAAIIIGSFASAVIGAVVASIVTLIEGIGFLRKVIEKYQASKAYNKQKSFIALIDSHKVPEGNEFDELLEIRAVELEHHIAKEHLTEKEKAAYLDELDFISGILKKKQIIIGNNKDSLAFMLQEHYKKREDKLKELIGIISLISPESTVNQHLDKIQLVQSEIQLIDDQIEKITAPIGKLALQNLIADEKLALSISTVSIAASGALLSMLGLLLIIGSSVAPPLVLGVIFGLGIGLAVVSLIKWGAEKITEREDAKAEKIKSEAHKESILDEALHAHEHQVNKNINPEVTQVVTPEGDSSHTMYMQDLVKDQPSRSSPPSVEPPIEDGLKGTYDTLFKKNSGGVHDQTRTNTTDDSLTPTK